MISNTRRSAIMSSATASPAALGISRQARAVSAYFTRIMVTGLMWLPAVFLMFVPDMHNEWLAWAGLTLTLLHGIAVAVLSLLKPDILVAVMGLFVLTNKE